MSDLAMRGFTTIRREVVQFLQQQKRIVLKKKKKAVTCRIICKTPFSLFRHSVTPGDEKGPLFRDIYLF